MDRAKARLGATRVVLEQQRGLPTHAAISKLQSKALVELFESSAEVITSKDRSDMASEVIKMQWASQSDLDIILTSLTSAVVPVAKKARRGQQNFMPITNYFTDEVWECITSTSTAPSAKLMIVLQFAARLGLRLPTEPTLKWMTSLFLVASEPDDKLKRMTEVEKRIVYHHTKATFNTLRAKLDEPHTWIESLPDNPFVFQQTYGPLYTFAFGQGGPGLPKLDMKKIADVDMSYGCRGGRPQARGVASSSAPSLQLPAPDSVMERMASFMLDRFENLMSSQSRVFELAITGGSSSCRGQPRALGTLGSSVGIPLEDRARASEARIVLSPVRHRPALMPPPPTTPAAEEKKGATIEEVTSPPTAANAGLAAVASHSAAGDILTMLDAYNQRKTNKTKRGRAGIEEADVADAELAAVVGEPLAKKAAKGGRPLKKKADKADTPSPKPPAKAEASPPKKLAKTSQPSPKELDKAGPPPPKKLAKASPMSPEEPATAHPPPLAKPGKCKTAKKGVEDTTAKPCLKKPLPKMVTGCSKCRWKVVGCGQCRNPSYTGKRWNITVG